MLKVFKRILIALLAVGLVAVALVATIPLWADMAQVKQYASDAVREATGKNLVMDGDLSFSLFPWLGVEARKVSLVDPGTSSPLAATDRVLVKVRLLALLKRRIEADTVTIEGLKVSFIRFESGKTNWDFPQGDGEASETGSDMLAFSLAGVRIENATVSIDDRIAGQRLNISDASLITGTIAPASPVSITLSGVATGIPETESIAFSLQSRVHPGSPALVADVERLDLALRQIDAQGGKAVLNVQTSGRVSWNGSDGAIGLQNHLISLSGRAPGFGINRLEARIDLPAAALPGTGTLDAKGIRIEGDASYGAPAISAGFSAGGDLLADIAGSVINLGNARLELRGLAAESLHIGNGRLVLGGDMALDQKARRAELSGLGIEGTLTTRGPAATTRFSTGNGRLVADLASGEVTLDTTAVMFNASAPDLGLQTVEGRINGPIRAGPEGVDLPQLVANLVLAPTDQSPSRVQGSMSLDTAVHFEPQGGTLRLPHLKSSFDVSEPRQGLGAKGSLAADIGVKLAGPVVQITALEADAAVQTPGTAKPVPMNVTGSVAADIAAQTLSTEGLAIASLGIDAKLSLKGKGIVDAPTWDGAVVTNRFDPSKVLTGLGMDLPSFTDKQVMRSLEIQGAFSASPGSAAIQTLDLRLDDSRIRGKLELKLAAAVRATFNLDIDRIDVDRYLPVVGRGSSEQTSAVEAGAALVPLLPKDLEVSGPLTIGDLRFQNMHTTRVKAELVLTGGILKVAPLDADMYGGKVTQRIVLDTAARTPKASFTMDARNINVGALLADLQGKERVTGIGAVAVELASAGVDNQKMVANLNGRGSFNLRDGAVKGVNVAQLIRKAQSAISGKALPADESLQTDFTELTGTFRIDEGVVRNDDLKGKSPLLRVNGKGQASLVTRHLDYLLDVSLVGTSEGQGGRGLDELDEVTIPITLSGTFTRPTYSLDPGRLLAERARQEIKRKLEKTIKTEAGGKIEDKLKQKLLEGIFGR